MKKITKLLGVLLILIFTGCTAINNYIGNNQIERGIAAYNKSGTTPYSISEVIDGLELSPESAIGIENLKVQFKDVNSKKDSILKTGSAYTFTDVTFLHAYLRTAEKLLNLYVKVPTLKGIIPITGELVSRDRENITRVIDRFIASDNTTLLSRKEKIGKIVVYRDLSRNISSNVLLNKIAQLEREVTVIVFVTSSVRGMNYDMGRIDVEGVISNSVEKNRGNQDNYVFLEGYVRRANYLPPNGKLVVIEIDYLSTSTNTKTEIKKDPEGKIIEIVESKNFSMRGSYFLDEGRGYYGNNSKPTNLNTTYQIKYLKGQNPNLAEEREQIEKLIDAHISSLVRRDIPSLF